MNVTSIILIVCLYPCILFMYAMIKNEATPEGGLYYGVTLNKEQQKEPKIEQISKEYKKQMRRAFWILMLIPVPMVFIPWFSIFMCAWMIWMMVSVFVFFIPFGIANKRMKELKVEKGWKESKEQQIYVEMKEAGRIRRVKSYHFIVQELFSVLIFVWSLVAHRGERVEVMSILVGSFAVITFLYWLVAVWMDKQKTQIISMDSDVNVNYNRAKKKLWKNFWVICAWVNVAYMVSLLFALNREGEFTNIFWVATIIYILLTIVVFVWMIRKKKALDVRYGDKMDMECTDEDDNWIWGMVYYNPRDKHSMVEKRVGIGTSVNMATPVGKGMAFFGGISLLSLPLICIWIVMLEFTPIQLTIEENWVTASHLKEDYSMSVQSIQNVELLTELPKMSRNHGTSIDNLKKGSYRIADEGSCSVFLNPQNTVFLRLETAAEIYYFSGYNDAQTMQVYEALAGGEKDVLQK